MKKFKNLLFLSIFILLSSCGQTIDFDDDKEYIEDKNKIISYKGEPYTGKMVKYYDKKKTQLQIEVFFKDGKRNGLTTENFENGFLKYKINYYDAEMTAIKMGVPAPGTYEDQQSLSSNGQYFSSEMVSAKSAKWCKDSKLKAPGNRFYPTPGPGYHE